MRLILTLFLALCFVTNNSQAQTADIQRSAIQSTIAQQRKFQDKSGFDMRFYHISFDINLTKQVEANVLCEFMSTKPNLSSIELNLSKQFKIKRILGASESFERDGEKITIKLRNKLKIGQVAWIKIFYESIQELNSIKGNHKDIINKEFIVNPINTFEKTPNWFPKKAFLTDKIDSLQLDLTIPDLMIDDIPIIAVGNGKLLDIVLLGTKRLFKWKHQYPISPNHIEFSVSNYRTIQQSVDFKDERMKITHYVFPKDYFSYLEQVSELPEMIKFFSQKLTKYPFSKDNLGLLQIGKNEFAQGQTNLPITGKSENQSNQLVYGLMKSWFGNYISAGSPSDQWLYDGLCAYSIALWNEHKSGSDGYQQIIQKFASYKDVILYSDKQTASNINFKGAYVFHMLRGVLGDKHFFEVLQSFIQNNKYQYGYANTDDFIVECKNISGQKLDYFFNQWLYGEQFPIYSYHFWKTDNKKVALQIIQTKRSTEPTFFVMPIEVQFKLNGKDTTVTIFNDKQSQTWEFNFRSKLKDAVLDPSNKLLKQVILKEQRLSSKSLVRDLKIHAEDDFNRYMTLSMRTYSKQWAIVELKTLDGKKAFYEELIIEDPFNETIKFPESVRKGDYILYISTDSSVFSREWTIKK